MKKATVFILAAIGLCGGASAQVSQRTNEVAPGLPGRAQELRRMSATPTPPPSTPVAQPTPMPRFGWRTPTRFVGNESGFGLDARYEGDRWRLNLRVGSAGLVDGAWGLTCRPKERWPYYAVLPASFRSGWVWVGNSWRWHDYDSSPVGGYGIGYTDPRLLGPIAQHPTVTAPAAPTPGTEAPPEPPTSMELALYAVFTGDSAGAVKALREHLRDEPEDVRAMRLLAFALVETRKFDDAASVMNLAYRKDPQLAFEVLGAEAFGFGERRLRELANACVTAAHRAKSGPGWLLVAVAMQAEGRDDLAGRMLERAVKEGLNKEVADAMRVALKG